MLIHSRKPEGIQNTPSSMMVMMCPLRLRFRDEVLPELGTSLIDSDRMPNDFGRAASSIRELASLHPCILKPWNGIDCIEQTQESYAADGSTECLSKSAHEVQEILLLVFLLFVPLLSNLPFLESFPGKLAHFLVASLPEVSIWGFTVCIRAGIRSS
jgi:hypothetical protein